MAGLLVLTLLACGGAEHHHGDHGHHDEEAHAEGPHGGRLLASEGFELELALVEDGLEPELRAWARREGRPVPPAEVSLRVSLTRLGGGVEVVAFRAEQDHLRGDRAIPEPHSFEVAVEAEHRGREHRWHYASVEGRTRIAPEVAEGLGIETALAGPAVLRETVTVYGRLRTNPERVRELRARFEGVVRGVHAEVGDVVAKGDRLLSIESDESLRRYSIFSPIAGVVTQRDANPDEQTSGRLLLTVTDPSSVWADLAVFPRDRARVRPGNPVSIWTAEGDEAEIGVISTVEVLARPDQSVVARAVLPNHEGRLVPGSFATAEIVVGEFEVPLAVRREGLQSFRDSTVVYARVGDQYEVRMLELGREDGQFVEVLGGLEPGTRYVSANSYIVKADIEKSGAAHDH